MNKKPQELENRIDVLESKISFQEETIQQLDDIIVDQQTRLERLEKSFRVLLDDVLAQKNQQPPNPDDDAPPPHY
jgi:SlyX protein